MATARMENLCAFCAVPSVSHTSGERLCAPCCKDADGSSVFSGASASDFGAACPTRAWRMGRWLFAPMCVPGEVQKTIVLLIRFGVMDADECGAPRAGVFTGGVYTGTTRGKMDVGCTGAAGSGGWQFPIRAWRVILCEAMRTVCRGRRCALRIPVVNFGPLGRDPHRAGERVAMACSFGKAPQLALRLTRLLMEAFSARSA